MLAAARAAVARAQPGASTGAIAECNASLLLEDAGCAAP
jgi:hypothetical protein